MKSKEYSDIIRDINFVKALKQKEEFWPENGVYDSVLNNYKMLEFYSDNVNMNEKVIDKVLRKAKSDYFNSHCFYISNPDYKTRIRSYKGFINSKFKNSVAEYKEQEIDIKDGKSFFIGVISLKSNYQDIFDKLFFYSGHCFIFCTNESMEQETLINKVLTTNGITNFVFNYYYLIQTFILKDELIIRAAGSDVENGVQIFSKK